MQCTIKSGRSVDVAVGKNKPFFRRLLSLAAASVLAAGGWSGMNLHATTTTQTWAPGGVDASGNWDTSTANWNPGPATWVNGNVAAIGNGGTSSYTVTIDTTGITASGLTFNAMGSGGYYIIAANSGDNLTLNNGGSSGTVDINLGANAAITAPITCDSNLQVTGNHTLAFSGSGGISFASGLTVTLGTGSMANAPTILAIATGSGGGGHPNFILDGGTFQSFDIGHSGQTLISEGGAGIVNTFDANNNSTSGVESSITQTAAGTTFVLQDGTINSVVDNSTSFTAGTLQIGSAASFNPTNVVFGYQVASANDNNLPASNVTISLDSAALTQASSNVTINGTTYTVDTANNTVANNIVLSGTGDAINAGTAYSLDIDGAISGTGSLTLNTGSSSQTVGLGGNNTYSGGTIVGGAGGAGVGSNTAFGTGGVTISTNGNSQIKYYVPNLTIANSLALATGSNDIINMHGNATGTWSGVIGGPGALTVTDAKNTGGQLTLSGANTYTGGTTVGDSTNNVSLNLTGSLANSNITILPHAGMTGTGTLNWNLVNNTGDLITADGGLTIAGLHLNIVHSGTQTLPDYIIANYSGGTLSGSSFASVNTLPTGWSINYNFNSLNEIALVLPITLTTLTWDPSLNHTGSDGNGNWDTITSNWATGSSDTAWQNGDIAAIGNGGAGGTITLDAPVTAAGLTFNTVTSPYTIAASGTGALTLSNAAGISIVMNANATISAPITFDNGFIVSGGHTLTISGTNNFVGTDDVQIGSGAAQATTVAIAGGGGSGGPAQITFDSGTFEFTTTGNGFNQPVISTDNGTAVTNSFDAGGAANSQDIASTITQSHADTFVLQDGTIYLTAANSSTFTNGTLQIGNGLVPTTVDFGFNGSNNLSANGVTITMNGATLTQASVNGPNGEPVDTFGNTISNAMTLSGSNTINTGTAQNLILAGNIPAPVP